MLFRSEQAHRSPLLGPALAIGYVCLASLAYELTTSAGGLAVLWLCNGLAAAALLLLPRRQALAVLAVGWAADFGGGILIVHSPSAQSMLLATLDSCEAVTVAVLARRVCGAGLDITRLPRLRALVLVAILPATLTAGTTGTLLFHVLYGQPLMPLWANWACGDVLGMTIAAPAVLLLARGWRSADRAEFPDQAIILGLIAMTALLCFRFAAQPTLFLLVVAALMATFKLDAPSVALGNVLIAVIGSSCTIADVGPIAALQPHDLGRRILFLQVFLAVVTLSTLATSALLSERDRIRRSLARTLAAARVARLKADEAARAKARFLATMSHEMRTPLNAVMGYAQALAGRAGLGPEVVAQAAQIQSSAEALACLVDDVLDFSQLDAGRVELRSLPFTVQELIEQASAMARRLVGQKAIEIVVEIGPGCDATLLGDGRRLNQVLFNLVSNAVKFTAKGAITIGASVVTIDAQTERCLIFVRDTGIGVPSGQADQLFAAFHQADGSTQRAYGGAGLGLAISRALIELMGGAMGCRSQPGEGAEFWIEAPFAPARAEPVAIAEEAKTLDERAPRVLVVDDHAANRQVASLLLSAFGCEVLSCEDGEAAVRAVETQDFDLVLMDVHMPGMDGLAASRAIRSMPGPKSGVVIIAMTAATSQEDVARCLAAGMNGHLPKPIRQEVVANTLRDLMAKAA